MTVIRKAFTSKGATTRDVITFTLAHLSGCRGCEEYDRPIQTQYGSLLVEMTVPRCQWAKMLEDFARSRIKSEMKRLDSSRCLSRKKRTARLGLSGTAASLTKGDRCVICERKLGAATLAQMKVQPELDTEFFVDGIATVVRACRPRCKKLAAASFEKDLQCFEKQKKELAEVQRVQQAMTAALSKMCREAV